MVNLTTKLRNEQRRKNYILLAENHYLQGDKEKAIHFYNKSIEFKGLKEEDIEILFNIALIYDELNLPLDSKDAYNRILKLDPTNPGAYYGIAIMEEQLGNDDMAIYRYQQAIKSDPEYDRAYFFLANLYDKLGMKDLAIDHYEKVLKLVPDDYHAYNNLGSIYEEMGEYKKAFEMFRKSIEIYPYFYKSKFNLGVVYKRLGNNKMALKNYYASLDLSESYHFTYLNISAIYIEEKEYEKSIEILTHGIESNKEADVLYYNRACCYAILGMEEEAISDIEESLSYNPNAIDWVKKDKDFKSLYSNNKFIDLLKEYHE